MHEFGFASLFTVDWVPPVCPLKDRALEVSHIRESHVLKSAGQPRGSITDRTIENHGTIPRLAIEKSQGFLQIHGSRRGSQVAYFELLPLTDIQEKGRLGSPLQLARELVHGNLGNVWKLSSNSLLQLRPTNSKRIRDVAQHPFFDTLSMEPSLPRFGYHVIPRGPII